MAYLKPDIGLMQRMRRIAGNIAEALKLLAYDED